MPHMIPDLEKSFEALAQETPSSPETSFQFTAETVSRPPGELQTPNLRVSKAIHLYDDAVRADSLWFYASKQTLRHLGLLVLAQVFHNDSRVRLNLTHPDSDVRAILIACESSVVPRDAPGYRSQPFVFNYWPAQAERHPWLNHQDLGGLPVFKLTGSQPLVTDDDWKRRDIIAGFGTDRASVLLAELFLNASRPENPINEYQLEGEGGFRGVGIFSAEVNLFLPGSLAWDR